MTRWLSRPCWLFSLALVAVGIAPAMAADRSDADERLRRWVYKEYPQLAPDHPDAARVSDWDRVRMLRDFSYRHTAYSNNVASKAYQAGAAIADKALSGNGSLIEVYEAFDRGEGGVVCGHTAQMLQRLYTLFGYDAWNVGHGFYPATPQGSSFTHAEVLVRTQVGDGAEGRELFTLHDPSANVSYVAAADGEPLDYFDLLRALAARRADDVELSTATGESNVAERIPPLTVCFDDETTGREPEYFVASWNVADEYQWTDRGDGVWLFRGTRTLAKFDRLGDSLWKPELVREGAPGETIYIHCYPFQASGSPGADEILAQAREIVGAPSAPVETTAGLQAMFAFPRPGEWPTFRAAPTLAGRVATAPGMAMSSAPQVAWKHSVATVVSYVAVEPASEGHEVVVPDRDAAAASPADWRRRWTAPSETVVIAGREQAMPNDQNSTFADILPEVPGLERVRFDSGFNLPTLNGRWQYGPGRVEAWRDGEWQVVWQSEPIDHCFNPYPMVDDFDGDGELEVAALPWRALQIYDARTGEQEQQCEFTEGRSYGCLRAADLDGDGLSEFVVLADFAKHVDVLGYRDGKLQLLWQHQIELDISDPHKILRVLPEPIADVDGDGVKDIVLNLYNDTGDERWHLIVRDGLTGDVKLDLADEAAQGVADLDADGTAELLTLGASGRHLPRFGTIRVRTMRDGRSVVAWESTDAGWEDQVYPASPLVRDYSRHARQGALVQRHGERAFAALRRPRENDAVDLSACEWQDGGFIVRSRIAGSNLTASAIDGDGAMLVLCRTPLGQETTLTASAARARCQAVSQSVGANKPPLALEAADGRQAIIVESDGQVVALDASRGGSRMVELWRRTGHSATTADLGGDGSRQVVFATASPTNRARIEAIDAFTGETRWRHDFERFSEGHPTWNPGGVMFCQVGQFTTRGRHDVLVTLQRSTMHSEETFLLSGVDGAEIWHRPRQIANRSCGGENYAIADFDGDGLDDAASFFTHIRYVLSGPTGRDIWAEENNWPEVPVSPAYWGQPVAGMFDDSGRPSLLYCNFGGQMVGRITADARLAWSDAYDKAANGYPAIGDFDGDGRLEALFIGFEDGARCYDAATGAVEWTLSVGVNSRVDAAISGDLDGDGRDEALFAHAGRLHCIAVAADSDHGAVAWTLELPGAVSTPVLAALPEKGSPSSRRLAVLMMGMDGSVICIQ